MMPGAEKSRQWLSSCSGGTIHLECMWVAPLGTAPWDVNGAPLGLWDSEVLSAVTVVTNWLLPLEFLSPVSWGLLTKRVEREDHLPHPMVPHSLHLFLPPSHILLPALSYHNIQKLNYQEFFKSIFSPFFPPWDSKDLKTWVNSEVTHTHTRPCAHTCWGVLLSVFPLMKICMLYDLRALSCYSLLK